MLFSQGGSNYSIFGLGDINTEGNAAYIGMGGTSIAMPMNYSINMTNPALWSKVRNTRLQAGYKFQQHMNQQEGFELMQNNGELSGANIMFMIDTALGIGVSFGLIPYSSVNYVISTPVEITEGELTLEGDNTYGGGGGVSSAYFGVSSNVYGGLSLGAIAYAHFGKIQREVVTNLSGDFFTYDYLQLNRDLVSGFGYRFGAYFDGLDRIGIGAFFENQNDLQIDRERIYSNFPLYNDTIVSTNITSAMPNSFGLGVSYTWGKFLIGADYSRLNFNDFTYYPGDNSEFHSMNTYSVGMNRPGNPSRNVDYLDRISYRAGLRYSSLYYNVEGQDINDLSISFGMRFPLTGSAGIDASFQLGQRGTEASGLVLEYYGKMSVDISIGETWFVPFRRQY